MISRLSGIIVDIQENILTLDVNGVGYEVLASQAVLTSAEINNKLIAIIYTDVKENSIKLYGFKDRLEKEVFKMLLQVSGVGAKTSSDILSHIDKNDLLRAIGSNDITRLQKVKGIGKKTAERILVELKDKVGGFASARSSIEVFSDHKNYEPFTEATEALLALGLSKKEAEMAVGHVQKEGSFKDSSDIVKAALRYI